MIKTVLTTAIAAAAFVSAPAFANDHAWQVGNDSIHIYYSDLDMNSGAGRAEMLARVERAAAKLCRERSDRSECLAGTMQAAMRAPGGVQLKLAIAERDTVQLAAR